jgi:bisphosphoglycerate-independent phosphoglycerate mutase (AlkP superfamily)
MSKILCVLDGFGLTPKTPNNAAALAKMPNFKYLLKNYFWTTLNADGENVGQEAGLVGNSEVGHMNIGGLKLVPQLSYQITKSADKAFDLNKEIAPDQFFDPKKFLEKKFAQNESKTIHLSGLFSAGQIHSDLRHWAGAIEAAGKAGAEKIVLHLISDGRDSDRQSLVATWDYFVKEFEAKIKPFEDKIFLGSLGGRFYAMDRDNNWERVFQFFVAINTNLDSIINQLENHDKNILLKDVWQSIEDNRFKSIKEKFNISSFDDESFALFMQEKLANMKSEKKYEELTVKEYVDILKSNNLQNVISQISELFDSPLEVIGQTINVFTKGFYSKNIFDEHIPPFAFTHLNKNDTIWLINFRTDRMKEFAQVLTDINDEFELNLTILANNSYGIKKEEFLDEDLEVSKDYLPGHFGEETYKKGCYYPIFKNQPVSDTLAEYISKKGQTQLHIAETEKYNHVTYFMNGGQNKKWENEDWMVIDSNKVASHAEKPEMKAKEVTDYILDSGLGKYDYILVNYANPDMVGHTGDIKAATTTMEFLDEQLGRLIQACEAGGHEMAITADHGNVEKVGEYDHDGKALIDTEHNANFVPLVILSEKLKVKREELGSFVSRPEQSEGSFSGLGLEILANVEKLIENKTANIDLNLLKKTLSEQNQVDLDADSWLTNEQIPEPVLPLWCVGLILITL